MPAPHPLAIGEHPFEVGSQEVAYRWHRPWLDYPGPALMDTAKPFDRLLHVGMLRQPPGRSMP